MNAIAYTQVTDIALDINGDWLIGPSPTGTDIQLIGDGPGLQQAVTIALQFFMGEWFLDQSAGIPWWQEVFVKNPNPSLLQAIFRAGLLAVPGVASINSLTISPVNAATRSVSIAFSVNGDLGELVQGTVEQQL